MTDFETHPVGTGKQLKELKSLLTQLVGHVLRDTRHGRCILSLSTEACAQRGAEYLQEIGYEVLPQAVKRIDNSELAGED